MRPAVSTARDLRPWNSVLVIGSPRTLLEMTFLYSRFGNCDRSRRQEPPAAGRRTPGHEPGSHLWGRAWRIQKNWRNCFSGCMLQQLDSCPDRKDAGVAGRAARRVGHAS